MTMVASFIVLRARYGLGKIGGAGIILAGAFVALIPLFTNNKNSDNPPALWYAILIYVYVPRSALCPPSKPLSRSTD